MDEPLRLVSDPGSSNAASAERTRAFEELVQAEHGRLYGALCLVTRDRREAEDVVQEAFLRVWERWDRVRGMEHPIGYLYTTAFNLNRKRLRRASVVVRRAVGLTPGKDELAEIEAREVVVRALAALSPRQRESIVLIDLLNYTSEEAAKVMGINPSTARVLASQGRAILRHNAGESDG